MKTLENVDYKKIVKELKSLGIKVHVMIKNPMIIGKEICNFRVEIEKGCNEYRTLDELINIWIKYYLNQGGL